jgi:hypothetical protein
MSTVDRFVIEQHAHQLRREEASRLLHAAGATITDWLRQRHEVALRRPPRAPRMRSAIATPV